MRPAVVLGTAAALVGGLTALLVPFVTPGMLRSFGVPFNPTETYKLQAMLRHLPPVRSGAGAGAASGRAARRTLVDLGSGDGRIVVAAAQQGHHAIGYEFNPWLVLYSRVAALTAGVSPLLGLRGSILANVTASDKPAQRGTARFVCNHTRNPHHKSISRDASERLLVAGGNMWSAPISSASCIVIYGVEVISREFLNFH